MMLMLVLGHLKCQPDSLHVEHYLCGHLLDYNIYSPDGVHLPSVYRRCIVREGCYCRWRPFHPVSSPRICGVNLPPEQTISTK